MRIRFQFSTFLLKLSWYERHYLPCCWSPTKGFHRRFCFLQEDLTVVVIPPSIFLRWSPQQFFSLDCCWIHYKRVLSREDKSFSPLYTALLLLPSSPSLSPVGCRFNPIEEITNHGVHLFVEIQPVLVWFIISASAITMDYFGCHSDHCHSLYYHYFNLASTDVIIALLRSPWER